MNRPPRPTIKIGRFDQEKLTTQFPNQNQPSKPEDNKNRVYFEPMHKNVFSKSPIHKPIHLGKNSSLSRQNSCNAITNIPYQEASRKRSAQEVYYQTTTKQGNEYKSEKIGNEKFKEEEMKEWVKKHFLYLEKKESENKFKVVYENNDQFKRREEPQKNYQYENKNAYSPQNYTQKKASKEFFENELQKEPLLSMTNENGDKLASLQYEAYVKREHQKFIQQEIPLSYDQINIKCSNKTPLSARKNSHVNYPRSEYESYNNGSKYSNTTTTTKVFHKPEISNESFEEYQIYPRKKILIAFYEPKKEQPFEEQQTFQKSPFVFHQQQKVYYPEFVQEKCSKQLKPQTSSENYLREANQFVNNKEEKCTNDNYSHSSKNSIKTRSKTNVDTLAKEQNYDEIMFSEQKEKQFSQKSLSRNIIVKNIETQTEESRIEKDKMKKNIPEIKEQISPIIKNKNKVFSDYYEESTNEYKGKKEYDISEEMNIESPNLFLSTSKDFNLTNEVPFNKISMIQKRKFVNEPIFEEEKEVFKKIEVVHEEKDSPIMFGKSLARSAVDYSLINGLMSQVYTPRKNEKPVEFFPFPSSPVSKSTKKTSSDCESGFSKESEELLKKLKEFEEKRANRFLKPSLF